MTSLADDSLTTGWIWLHQPAHTLPQRPALCLLNPRRKRPGWADGNWQFSPRVASNLPFLHLLLADILNILFYLFGCAGSWVFPGGSEGKESACSAGDQGSVPGSGRSLGGGHGNSLQYSCLENPRGRGAWWASFQGVTKCQTQLNPLSMLGLSCCTQGLWFSLWHVDLCVCVCVCFPVVACGIFSCDIWALSCNMWDQVPWTGIEPGPPALEAWSSSHWTTREVPVISWSCRHGFYPKKPKRHPSCTPPLLYCKSSLPWGSHMLGTHSQSSPSRLSSISTFDPTFMVEFCNTKTLVTARPRHARGDLPGRCHLWLPSWLRLISQSTGHHCRDCSWLFSLKWFGVLFQSPFLFSLCVCVCLKLIFYWSIVSVQCCVNLCGTRKWTSSWYTYTPLFWISLSFRSAQSNE